MSAATLEPPISLEFTEEMKGFVTFGEDDYDRGYRQGRRDGNFLMFHLTIATDDVDRFIADENHVADARGWVECERLGGRLPVERGVFNLFVSAADPSRTNMLYRLFFRDGSGAPLTLAGFKDVKDDPGFDVWADTSTLYTRVFEGHVDPAAGGQGRPRAIGIINIYMLDFIEQLTTFRVHGPDKEAEARALASFGRLFMGQLWDLYRHRAEESAGR